MANIVKKKRKKYPAEGAPKLPSRLGTPSSVDGIIPPLLTNISVTTEQDEKNVASILTISKYQICTLTKTLLGIIALTVRDTYIPALNTLHKWRLRLLRLVGIIIASWFL